MVTLDLKRLDQKNSIEHSIDNLTNFDAEIAVIGCLLWDNRSYDKISDFLNEQHFSNENNKKIYKIIKKLLDQNILVTPITLKSYLEKNNGDDLDNFSYLNQIKDSTPSTHNTFQYARLLYDLHIKRSLISIGNEMIHNTIENEEDLGGTSLIEIAENNLYNLSQTGNIDRKHLPFSDALREAVDIIDKSFQRDGKIAGITTGLRDIDKKLGGLHNSDLIIIAGRPSMGKTSLGTNIAFNAAQNYKDCFQQLQLNNFLLNHLYSQLCFVSFRYQSKLKIF